MNTTKENKPDYKRIYRDLVHRNHHEMIKDISKILEKENFNALDIMNINEAIFGKTKGKRLNTKLRSYDKSAIMKILDYQKKNHLNNSQLAMHFGLSRNTVAKWKKATEVYNF